eukprot:100026-Hanusia_phi.AAC.2
MPDLRKRTRGAGSVEVNSFPPAGYVHSQHKIELRKHLDFVVVYASTPLPTNTKTYLLVFIQRSRWSKFPTKDFPSSASSSKPSASSHRPPCSPPFPLHFPALVPPPPSLSVHRCSSFPRLSVKVRPDKIPSHRR